jgi:hypothetical protein
VDTALPSLDGGDEHHLVPVAERVVVPHERLVDRDAKGEALEEAGGASHHRGSRRARGGAIGKIQGELIPTQSVPHL